jgi:hypothetical protein
MCATNRNASAWIVLAVAAMNGSQAVAALNGRRTGRQMDRTRASNGQ